MITAYAITNSENKTVYKIKDNVFNSIEEIFQSNEYITLNPVNIMNLIEDILFDTEYIFNVDKDYIKDIFWEYINSLDNDALSVDYTNITILYIHNRSKYDIKDAIWSIVEKQQS